MLTMLLFILVGTETLTNELERTIVAIIRLPEQGATTRVAQHATQGLAAMTLLRTVFFGMITMTILALTRQFVFLSEVQGAAMPVAPGQRAQVRSETRRVFPVRRFIQAARETTFILRSTMGLQFRSSIQPTPVEEGTLRQALPAQGILTFRARRLQTVRALRGAILRKTIGVQGTDRTLMPVARGAQVLMAPQIGPAAGVLAVVQVNRTARSQTVMQTRTIQAVGGREV